MRFCQSHWDALRAAIDARGLSHLVARSGKEACERLVAESKGEATDATWDPLMAAHNMIVSRVLELGGPYIFTGDYCPVCEAIRGHAKHMTREQVEKHYTDGPADAVLQLAREKGLVPQAG